MRMQKLESVDGTRISYSIVDDNYVPFQPAESFLMWAENTGKSPNTVKAYAVNLTVFLNFLESKKTHWTEVKPETFSDYIRFLQFPSPSELTGENNNLLAFPRIETEAKRKPSTINAMVAAVVTYYKYHALLGHVPTLAIYTESFARGGNRYKPFLHHITKGKTSKKNQFKLKTTKSIPKIITRDDFGKLVNACSRTRDRFLLCLLFESGMRIGQALGLRHEDIHSYDNEIIIVPRNHNVNFARAKTDEGYTVHVTQTTMALYTDYLLEEFCDTDSDYVFVNLWSAPVGRPMRYPAIAALFNRLKKKTGVLIHPHLLRHTHATEFIRAGGRMDVAQRRLGHKSVQTTTNIYVHANQDDMKREHAKFIEQMEKNK